MEETYFIFLRMLGSVAPTKIESVIKQTMSPMTFFVMIAKIICSHVNQPDYT